MIDWQALNHLAIAVSAAVGFFLGALWYSPVLFGNAWLHALGKTERDLGKPGPAMLASAVGCLITATVMAILVYLIGVDSWVGGAWLGAGIGVGVVAMALLSEAMFSDWPWSLYFIQTGYRVVYLSAMGAVLGAWQ